MGKYFTEEQVLMYIQQAYAKAKAEGTLDVVNPVVPASVEIETAVAPATENK